MMRGCQAVTIHIMTNNKGREVIMLCTGAAVAAIAAVYGIGANGESPSNITTAPTITTTKSPFSGLTQVPAPPATAGGQTDGAVPGRLVRGPEGGPEGCIAGLNCGCVPRLCNSNTPRRQAADPPRRQPPADQP